jgi:acyl-coenzyme A synthetase/AMP-(fatty) acid ligase
MLLIDMIFFWARTVPDRMAIIQPEMVTTYGGLADAIESIGRRIGQLNLESTEPVAVSLSNPSYMLVTCLALMRSGYRIAPINTALLPHLRPAGIPNVIYDTQGQVLSGGRNIRFDLSWLAGGAAETTRRGYRDQPRQDPDAIFFTSGTTGLPKKVVQAAAALDELLKYPFTCACGAHQKILIMPGLSSTFGFNRACEVLDAGKTACFAPSSGAALPLVDIFGVELIVASALQALGLVAAKKKEPGYSSESLTGILVGGGKIGPEVIADIRATLCRNVVSQYGSTEAGVIAVAPFDLLADRPGAIGCVMPWTELQIVDEAGHELPAGAEGLIRYRTPQLIENIKSAGSDDIPGVRDRWFYPGDIGSVTADGILCLAGRSSDVINRGGIKVSASRIEEILQGLPEIKEAAACGIAARSGLEEIWIAVVANGPVDIEAIKRLLGEHSDVKIAPDEVFLLHELPRGDLGKVQKYRLKELMLGHKKDA